MVGKYKNLVEDEKEARQERYGLNFASILIIIGIIMIFFFKPKTE